MSKKDMIRKALLLNNVCEDDIVVVKTDTTTFHIHLFNMLVLLLYNFSLQKKMSPENIFHFIMKNFNEILDTTITEIEIALLHFSSMYDEDGAEEIELHNKDECLLVVAMQNKFNIKLEKIIEV